MKKNNVVSILPYLRPRPERTAQKGKADNIIHNVRFTPVRRPSLPPAA